MPPFSGWILSNLSSPEARGSVGKVAQEEMNRIIIPPIKTAVHIDLIINILLKGDSKNFGRAPG